MTLEDALQSPATNTTRFASWFSGELRVPQGRQLLCVHNGYSSVYERDMIFRVRSGIVEVPKIVDNSKGPVHWEYGYGDSRATPLGSFDITRIDPDLFRSMGDAIIAGYGLGGIKLGASRGEIAAILGGGEVNYRSGVDDFYFADFGHSALQVMFQKQSHEAVALYFFNKGSVSLGLKTSKGLGFDATTEDVRRTYGETKDIKRRAISDNNPPTIDYAYPGIGFRFEDNKLVRITIRPTS